MQSEQPSQHLKHEEQSAYFLPFDVQLQNISAIEIVAKRFPVDISQTQLSPNVGLQVSEVHILTEYMFLD